MNDSNKAPIVLATRGSQLALWQATYVAEKLKQGGLETTREIVKTMGDRVQDRSLHEIGGKGLFIKEIEEKLLSGQAHLAVHSLKDMPAELPASLTLGAIMARHSPLDALIISNKAKGKFSIPDGELTRDIVSNLPAITIGTGSLRRQALLREVHANLKLVPIRGNVDTRIRKLQEGEWDAIILAHASLERLSIDNVDMRIFDPAWFVPSPAQGALAVEVRSDSPNLLDIDSLLACKTTRTCTEIERQVLRALGADCTMPLGCHVNPGNNKYTADAVVLSRDGGMSARAQVIQEQGEFESVENFANKLLDDLYANGAKDVLAKLASELIGGGE